MTESHLHARVFRTAGQWYADIDDELFPQPDNPLWHGSYPSQSSALAAACTLIAELSGQGNAIHSPTASVNSATRPISGYSHQLQLRSTSTAST
ncbi:hypothetical protein GCM10009534_31590 [Kribbella sandramycini]